MNYARNSRVRQSGTLPKTRNVEYDERIDAHVVEGPGSLITEKDFDAWEQKLLSQLEVIGRKVYLLVDLADFKISPAISELYGNAVKEVTERFALGVIRYNSSSSTTATIRIEAVVNQFPSNVYPDRESAEQALKEMREQHAKV